MATTYTYTKTEKYICAWKCEYCGHINIQNGIIKQEKSYRSSTKYTKKGRMQDISTFRGYAEESFVNKADELEKAVNSGESISDLQLPGLCNNCRKKQKWGYKKYLEVLMLIPLFIILPLVFWFLNSILKLSSELALVITLLGGPFLSLYPMGAVAILLDKFRKKRMARITDPEEKPFIIGKETIEKVINQSDPQLLNDARIIEWKKLYGLK